MDGRDRDRVLGGQRDDRAHPVAAEARERLQVGLDPGAAAGVRGGDREAAGNHWERRLASCPWRLADAWDGLLDGRGGRPRWQRSRRAGRARPPPSRTSLHPQVRAALLGARRRAASTPTRPSAYAAAARGEHLVVATGTASGKTLAFNLPVLDALAAEPKLRALYLYPTKALAQDQARALAALRRSRASPGDLRRRHRARAPLADPQVGERRSSRTRTCSTSACCRTTTAGATSSRTSATSSSTRRTSTAASSARTSATSSGACGAQRRDLRRRAAVPARLGDDRQPRRAGAVAARRRATVIGDDARAARRAHGRPLEPAAPRRGARSSARARSERLRGSSPTSSTRGLRTIFFTKSRKAAELIHRFAADRVDRSSPTGSRPTAPATRPAQRREIERRLVEGELLGVTATDALELGIDIGLLDCAISVGFPGTVASLRQQWGRAGRRSHGLAVLVASEDALDQFFMREPEALLGRRVEAAILDHANPRVLDGHVRAAAFEAPLDDRDRAYARATRRSSGQRRSPHAGELKRTSAGYVWAGRDYPAGRLSLRSIERRGHRGRRRRDRHRPRARRARSARTRRFTRAPSTSTWASPTRARARPRRAGRRSSSRSPATTTRRRRRRRRRRSRAAELAERRLGHGRLLRPRVRDRAGRSPTRRSRSGTRRRSTSSRSTYPRPLRDGGGLVPARALDARRAGRCSRACSARSTPPSTR